MKLQVFICLTLVICLLSGCGTVMGVKAPPESRTMERIIDVANAHKDKLYIKAS